NFDALNDVENLKYSGERIAHHGLNHEVVVTMMELPPGCTGAHDVAFYEKVLREILDAGIPYSSICFKDASGTSSPQKVYETIQMARKLVPEGTHLRLHTHETAGVSVACYMAALDAGIDGIDMAAAPVSGGTSQPDILTMLHAVKGKPYDLGGLKLEDILTYEEVVQDCLKDYFMPPEATMVSPLIPFSPMPGGALTANTQMMRDNNILDRYTEVIKAMREVVEKGGYGTSVTPVSQFYFQQAYANVTQGPWKKITDGYGKMVLGYFGRTPVPPDPDIVQIAEKQLGMSVFDGDPLDILEPGIPKAKKILEAEGLPVTEENLFIIGALTTAGGNKGLDFLKGARPIKCRKITPEKESPRESVSSPEPVSKSGDTMTMSQYKVTVDGSSYEVIVEDEMGKIAGISPSSDEQGTSPEEKSALEVKAQLPGNVYEIQFAVGDRVKEGETLVILEAMKMETPVISPSNGIVNSIEVVKGQIVQLGQVLLTLNE
ncbi:MAG: biotin attachment protein, partial [Desulfobacula sp.]|nr:biotin attachment protein [Desulfobacula sp.]